ncbi:hypothetical protein Tco_0579110 [Tanacetum coccineum]
MAEGPTSPCGGSHESGGDSSPRGGNDREQDSSGKAVLAREFLHKCTSRHSESYTGNGEVRIASNSEIKCFYKRPNGNPNSNEEDGVTQCLECLDFAIMAVILLLLLLPADKRASPPKIPELSKGANYLQAEGLDLFSKSIQQFSLAEIGIVGAAITCTRPDIMFVVCTCARFQVTPKVSHSHAIKRIFRYLKGKPKLGLWYPRDSPFDLVAYSDSDYAGASLDRKSTTGGCQFLGCKIDIMAVQRRKQTVVANLLYKKLEMWLLLVAVGQYLDSESNVGLMAKHIEYLMLNASPLTVLFEGRLIMSICSQAWMEGHVGDEAVHKELGDRMEMAAHTSSSYYEAEQ